VTVPEVRVELAISSEIVVVVHDKSSHQPTPGPPALDGTGGRGLFLAAVMPDDLGWTRTPGERPSDSC